MAETLARCRPNYTQTEFVFFPRIRRIPRLKVPDSFNKPARSPPLVRRISPRFQTSLFMSVSAFLSHDSFELGFGIVAKVDQETQSEPRRLEVVLNLSPVLVGEVRYRFELQDDLVV